MQRLKAVVPVSLLASVLSLTTVIAALDVWGYWASIAIERATPTQTSSIVVSRGCIATLHDRVRPIPPYGVSLHTDRPIDPRSIATVWIGRPRFNVAGFGFATSSLAWAVWVPSWAAIVVTGVPAAIGIGQRVRARRLRHSARRCAACGYDLRATPDRCPECGAVATIV